MPPFKVFAKNGLLKKLQVPKFSGISPIVKELPERIFQKICETAQFLLVIFFIYCSPKKNVQYASNN
jgi:hypothetical protein